MRRKSAEPHGVPGLLLDDGGAEQGPAHSGAQPGLMYKKAARRRHMWPSAPGTWRRRMELRGPSSSLVSVSEESPSLPGSREQAEPWGDGAERRTMGGRWILSLLRPLGSSFGGKERPSSRQTAVSGSSCGRGP
ncbi:unnamed protein product [Lota lota]